MSPRQESFEDAAPAGSAAADKARRRQAYRGVFALCAEAGISDKQDRIALARELLHRGEEFTSFTELDLEDLDRLMFALRAWRSVQMVRLYNGSLEAEARVLLDQTNEVSLLLVRGGG